MFFSPLPGLSLLAFSESMGFDVSPLPIPIFRDMDHRASIAEAQRAVEKLPA